MKSCEHALDQVEDAFSGGPRDNDPDWLYRLNREEIDVMAGRCYTELHQPGKAERLLPGAITRLRYIADQLSPHKDTAIVADFFDAYETAEHEERDGLHN